MGKGGKDNSPTQTSSNVTNTNVPEYARPYVENMLGATQQQLFNMDGNNITGFQPYKAYGGTYDASGNQTAYDPSKAIAGFSPLQQQAQQGAATMQAGPGDFNAQVGAYMSPFMQNVTDIQKREAARASGIQGIQQQAQAAQAGAFGGSRDAIQRAERERNLSQQMNDIQSQGLQAAYGQATNQYNQGFGQNMQINQLQNTMGQQQQQNQQQIINQSLQDYANAQQYPLMQLGTMSNMLRGLPMQSQTTQQYQAQANPITQGIGALGAGASLYNATKGQAEGGAVKSMASGGITSVPRYDVGGAVISQLATMPDEALKKEAMESPSPRVREMAAAILKQRQAGLQAEPQAAEAPQGVGPMGVDYNANYAGGGIIAFARGRNVPQTPLPPLTDAQKEAMNAGVMQAVAAGRGEGKLKADIQPTPSASMDTGVRQAGIQMAGDAASGLAAAAAPPAGIVPAPAAAAAPPVPVETDPGRAAIADAKKLMEPFAKEANMSTREIYERDLADKKALGLDNSEARQKLMQQQMAERANLGDEADRANWMRRAQFFAEMASTPGNTLVAGMVALKNRIPDFIQDAKDQKLARQQADKAIYELGEADRLEKLGAYTQATATKQTAIKTMAELQSHLTTASVQQGSAEKQLQGNLAQAAATVTAGQGHDAATIKHAEINERSALATTRLKDATDRLKIQEDARARAAATATAADEKAFRSYDAATSHLRNAIQGAEQLRSGKDYQNALADLTMTDGQIKNEQGVIDPAKLAALPSFLKEKRKKALETIERIDTNITTAIDSSTAVADAAFGRLRIAPNAGRGFPEPPAEAISVLKNSSTPQARAQFDQIFGPGAAAKALGR